jgi:hypothetical protein
MQKHLAAFLRRPGQSTVEFAMAGLLGVTLLYAVFEVGRLAIEQVSIANAAREAARVGIIVGATDADIQTRALQIAVVSGDVPVVQIVNYTVDSTTPIPNQTPIVKPSGTPRANGDLVQVTVSHTFRPVAFLKTNGIPVSSNATMRVE